MRSSIPTARAGGLQIRNVSARPERRVLRGRRHARDLRHHLREHIFVRVRERSRLHLEYDGPVGPHELDPLDRRRRGEKDRLARLPAGVEVLRDVRSERYEREPRRHDDSIDALRNVLTHQSLPPMANQAASASTTTTAPTMSRPRVDPMSPRRKYALCTSALPPGLYPFSASNMNSGRDPSVHAIAPCARGSAAIYAAYASGLLIAGLVTGPALTLGIVIPAPK